MNTKEVRRGRQFVGGFTLVELLVVIVIIGILVALLLSALSGAKAQANSNTCKNHLHEMGLALQMYLQDNGNRYPYDTTLAEPPPANPSLASWFNKLEPYYPIKWTNRVYHCPGYNGAIDASTNYPRVNHDPLGSYAYNFRGIRGYASQTKPEVNLGLGQSDNPHWQGPPYGVAVPPVPENQVKVPSEMFAIGESRYRQEIGINTADCVSYMFCGYLTSTDGGAITFPARHGKNYNQLFCDGHTAATDPWVLFNPADSATMWNNDHQPHRELWPPE